MPDFDLDSALAASPDPAEGLPTAAPVRYVVRHTPDHWWGVFDTHAHRFVMRDIHRPSCYRVADEMEQSHQRRLQRRRQVV